jgi:hypothetical protein
MTVKVIDRGWAKPNDPIYSSGLMVTFRSPLMQSTETSPSGTDGAQQPERKSSLREQPVPDSAKPDPMQQAADGIEEFWNKKHAQATAQPESKVSAPSASTTATSPEKP